MMPKGKEVLAMVEPESTDWALRRLWWLFGRGGGEGGCWRGWWGSGVIELQLSPDRCRWRGVAHRGVTLGIPQTPQPSSRDLHLPTIDAPAKLCKNYILTSPADQKSKAHTLEDIKINSMTIYSISTILIQACACGDNLLNRRVRHRLKRYK